MSPVGKDPPEGPPGEPKIDPKSKKCVIFSLSKHDHFLGRLQDHFFFCFGSPGGSKSMLFRVPERLPACFGSFYAHMQILSPLPCFCKVFQDVKTSKINKNEVKIEVGTALLKNWVPKSIFSQFWLDLGTLWEPQDHPKAAQNRKSRLLKTMQISSEFRNPPKRGLGVTWRNLTLRSGRR